MSSFGLVVRFVLRPGHEQLFDELVASTLAGIHGEPGTLIYASHSVEGEPRVRIFYELYADRAAFDVHEAEEHVRYFLGQREQHVESFTVDFLGLLAAKGVPAGESA
jgi:quinol monooxygenase YgiN